MRLPRMVDACARDVDAGVVLREIETRPADLEAFDRDVGGPDGDDVRRAVADEGGPAVADAASPAGRW